jgi:NAD(P)-dependent dehydrogenase (short-subunit alcohol dehydrogenase family)
MSRLALIIGNSDGIGRALTRRLLSRGWRVTGVSRSDSGLTDPGYEHHVADVSASEYPALLERLIARALPDLVVYCAGIGEELNLEDMRLEARTFEVNLLGMVHTAAAVIPPMVARGSGHFLGLSSLADQLALPDATAYCASKAGFSNYLAGLARATRRTGVAVTCVRFGFVDTKMAKGTVRPLMLPVERAVDHLERCIRRRPARHTAPRLMIPLVHLTRLATWLGIG